VAHGVDVRVFVEHRGTANNVTRNLTFSIVTPSFNQASFLAEALRSVKTQHHSDVEHLVIDGSSTDGTLKVLDEYSATTGWEHLKWTSEPDRGQSHALNKGFARAQGDIVGWLNSDDRYRPGCFDRVIREFERHPEMDILYGDYCWIDEAGHTYKIRREIEFNKFILLYHRVLYIPTTATFLRRRVFEDGHYLSEHLHYALDFEFFVRLAVHGYRFRHTSAVLGDFRFQRDSKTCLAPHKQLEEKDRVTELYSPILCSLRSSAARRLAHTLLRSAAATLRYSEKLLRGYYLEQRRLDSASS
jgi:glycosyltransferase involved in cell wall biosynthesis